MMANKKGSTLVRGHMRKIPGSRKKQRIPAHFRK